MAGKKRIIDEKGKLFGKINVIDLLLVAVLVVILAVVGMKLMNRGNGAVGDGGQGLRYTVLVPRMSQEVYDAVERKLKEGAENNTLMANGEMLNGQVESVTAVPHKEGVRRADGAIVVSEEPGFLDATFTIKAVVSNRITQAIGTQEIRVGKSHIVKTKTYELINGIILTCDLVEAGK